MLFLKLRYAQVVIRLTILLEAWNEIETSLFVSDRYSLAIAISQLLLGVAKFSFLISNTSVLLKLFKILLF